MGRSQPTPTRFGALLRHWRLAAGLTQQELAERAGLSLRGVSDLERELHQARRDTVQMLADALQLNPEARAAFAAAARAGPSSSVPTERHRDRDQLTVPSPRFVGRLKELARIEQHLAGSNASVPPALFFAGEPGIGKSRLLQEAGERAAAAGWRVLAGGCTRRSGQEPFAPFVATIARSIARLSSAEQRRALQGCAWLVRLLPELAETAVVPAPSWTLPPEQERRLMFAAIARYLSNAAGPAGTLLLLDDVQWAGADALDLLDSLVRSVAEGASEPRTRSGLRMIVAYRSTEVEARHPLGALQADLARTGLAERCTLGRLSAAEAEALAENLLAEAQVDQAESASLTERVTCRADGVPFYLVNYAQAIRAGTLTEDAATAVRADGDALGDAGAEAVPWVVAETIRHRVAVLPEPARDLLDVAAVIGRVVSVSVLLPLVARTMDAAGEDEALAALESACAAGLLFELGGDYHFAHDLIREVVLSDLSTARGRVLHRRVADALVELPDRGREQHIAEIAQHYLDAGDGAAALPFALQAGDQAEAVYAHAEAERHYRTAVELASAHDDLRREAEALEKLGSVLLRLARYDETLATIEAALVAYRALGDVEGEARVAEGFQHPHYFLATPEIGIARLGSLLDDFRGRGLSGIGQARLYSALAHLFWRSGWFIAGEAGASRLSEAVVAAERAMELARAAHNDAVLVHAMFDKASTLTWLGRVEESLTAHEDLLPLAEAIGDLWTLFAGLVHLQVFREYRGEFALMQRYIDRCIALVDQVGDPRSVAHMWGNQAELAYYLGDWRLARTAIERSLEIVRAYDLGAVVPEVQCYMSQLYLVAGEQEQADKLSAGPLAVAQEKHDLQALRYSYSLIAERDLLAGRAQAVRTYLEPMLDRPGLEEPQVLYVLPQYAWALLALSEQVEAEARAIQSCERARAWQYHLFLVDGLRVLAMVRMRQERWDEAHALLQESIELCRTMPYPYAEAKALYIYGQLHAAKCEPEQAREKYQEALAICERLGEGLYRPHIERALANLPD